MTVSSNHNDRDLLEFADAINAGYSPQPQNDLERTYLHVQRAIQIKSTDADMKRESWEEIMGTLAIPIGSQPPRRESITRRPGWSAINSIAAALLLLVVGFGAIHFMSIPSAPDPNAPPSKYSAGFVPISTPTATEITESSFCSDMTAETEVTVLETSNAKNRLATNNVLVWLEDDRVMARCSDGSEITLAEGMTTVSRSNWPQTITYFAEDPRMLVLVHQNVRTGEKILEDASTRGGINTGETGTSTQNPLRAIVSEQDGSQWSIANMNTMTEVTLLEISGLRVYSGQSITATGSMDGSTIAVAVSMYESEGSARILRVPGAPGDVFVVSTDFDDGVWVSIPNAMGPVNNISLSDDGTKLTFVWDSLMWLEEEGEYQRITVDIATGEIVAGD